MDLHSSSDVIKGESLQGEEVQRTRLEIAKSDGNYGMNQMKRDIHKCMTEFKEIGIREII